MNNLEKYESIFDHGVTKEEYEEFFGGTFDKGIYYSNIRSFTDNIDKAIQCLNIDLYYLYYYRRNKEMAMRFADRIQDCDGKWFQLLNHDYNPLI